LGEVQVPIKLATRMYVTQVRVFGYFLSSLNRLVMRDGEAPLGPTGGVDELQLVRETQKEALAVRCYAHSKAVWRQINSRKEPTIAVVAKQNERAWRVFSQAGEDPTVWGGPNAEWRLRYGRRGEAGLKPYGCHTVHVDVE
jgi:hypothetical protein